MNPQTALDGIFLFVAFLFSTTVHEAAHAWVALLGGDPTAYRGGQVSLSPLPHIQREPIGMLVVPLLTAFTQGWAMGWASAPYDPYWADRYPRRAAWMAAAGPGGNLCIALVAFVLMRLGLAAEYFVAPDRIDFSHLVAPAAGGPGNLAGFLAQGLSVFLSLNVLLCVLNLAPLPPLDGSTVIGLFLKEETARRLRHLAGSPQFSFAGLLFVMLVFPRFISPQLLNLVIHLVHPGASYH